MLTIFSIGAMTNFWVSFENDIDPKPSKKTMNVVNPMDRMASCSVKYRIRNVASRFSPEQDDVTSMHSFGA